MGVLATEIARARAQGVVSIGNQFTKAIRDVELNNLEKGDVFTIPTEFDVQSQKIGENTAEFIFVEVAGGNVKRFFPSTFSKMRTIHNEDGTSTGQRVFTTGKAAEDFRKYGTVQEGMENLKGKKLIITDMKPVRCLRYGTTTMNTEYVPVIDYAQ